MTGVIKQVETFHINGWTIRPCTEDGADGFDLLHGHERYHHDRLEVAVASAQASKREVESAVTHQVGKSGVDPVRMLHIWCEELGLRAGTREADARRALLLQVIEYIDARHKTIQRLNDRCQKAESIAVAFRNAVDTWEFDDGKTYVPLHSLVAIAKKVGKEVDIYRLTHHGDRMRELEKRLADAQAKLNDEARPRLLAAQELPRVKAQLERFIEKMPSWLDSVPQDYDAWLRDIVPDGNRLRFYQWIGMLATREALDELRDMLKDDPVPVEHRSYTPDDVFEFLDGIDPAGKAGDPVPSRLPVGRPFCDVDWHVHLDGGSRLPSCRLDSER